MKIGQIVKTSDHTCKASIFQIKGDRVRIKMTWKSGLSYISDFHQYGWYDKADIAPL